MFMLNNIASLQEYLLLQRPRLRSVSLFSLTPSWLSFLLVPPPSSQMRFAASPLFFGLDVKR